ncbi:DNA-protecting protein DprA [Cobetia sp. ICG0124]|nr:DNA-protecting protein DprA [Cobetia sp. ICG0124]
MDVEQRRPSRADFVFLARLPGIGTHTVAKLLERADWPQGWLAALPSRLAAPVRLWCERPASSPLHQQVMTDLAWHAPEQGRHLLTPADADWPAMLALLPDPPIALWALGRRSLLEQPMLAIVGARKASPAGMTHAHDLAAELVSRGWSVASGLALGIDAAAHQGALNAALRLEADAYPAPPSTLAVLGCGVDVTYPAQHHQLRLRLLESGGLLLSEHPPGTGAHARHFPRRNRLITGLSHGVLVVEATLRSGSLVSARLAMEQNREVFALPGRIDDIASSGCLELIRQGATLVRDVDDMLAELSHLMPTAGNVNSLALADAAALGLPDIQCRLAHGTLLCIACSPVAVIDDTFPFAVGRVGQHDEAASEFTGLLLDFRVACRAGGLLEGLIEVPQVVTHQDDDVVLGRDAGAACGLVGAVGTRHHVLGIRLREAQCGEIVDGGLLADRLAIGDVVDIDTAVVGVVEEVDGARGGGGDGVVYPVRPALAVVGTAFAQRPATIAGGVEHGIIDIHDHREWLVLGTATRECQIQAIVRHIEGLQRQTMEFSAALYPEGRQHGLVAEWSPGVRADHECQCCFVRSFRGSGGCRACAWWRHRRLSHRGRVGVGV